VEEVSERRCRSRTGSKALKGETQERWELKEAAKDLLQLGNRREGSQTLSTALSRDVVRFWNACLEEQVKKKGEKVRKC
jgi:hypothetical protein